MSTALHSLIEVRLHWAERHCWSAGRRLRQERLPAHCLWIGQSGVIEALRGAHSWRVARGQALLFPRGASREIHAPQPTEWISIGLTASAPAQPDLLQFLPSPLFWRAEAESAISFLAAQLALAGTDGGATALLREALARALFGALWQRFGAADLNEAAGANVPNWLSEALRRMREAPAAPLGVLAREVGISPSQLRRGFHEFLGASPQEYSRRRRLEAARHAVETSEVPLHLIAAAHGFSSAALFSRAMKKAFGLSPLELRQAAQQPPL